MTQDNINFRFWCSVIGAFVVGTLLPTLQTGLDLWVIVGIVAGCIAVFLGYFNLQIKNVKKDTTNVSL